MKMGIVWEENNRVLFPLIQEAECVGKEMGMQVELFPLKPKEGKLYEKLKKLDAEYLLTFDMAGFENDTYLEVPMYNLLFAKQIHILLNNNSKYQKYLYKNLGLNLFLFMSNTRLLLLYREKYPHLLNLEEMPELETGINLSEELKARNREILKVIMERVRFEAETAGH